MTREEKIAILKDIIAGEIIHPQVRKDVGEWAIKALEQEPKTGHWIKAEDDLHNVYSCSECGSKTLSPNICKCKFCYNCGAKMVEPQESEDKE